MRGRQQQVPERVPEHVAFAGQQAVDGDHAGDRGDDVVERHIQPARCPDPTEPGVEQQQADQPQPEHRHGIAEQADEADRLVLPAAAMGRGQHAHRHADDHADEQGQRRQFQRGREYLQQVVQHGARGDDGIAEIAVQHLHQVAPVLHGHGQVEPDLGAHPRIGLGRALSPTMASTGSIGITRPMKKVTQVSPRKVSATESRLRAVRLARLLASPQARCPRPPRRRERRMPLPVRPSHSTRQDFRMVR